MKLSEITEFISTLSKNPQVAMGIIFTSVPAICGAGYVMITQYNKVASIIESYDDTSADASSAKRNIATLTDKASVNHQTLTERINAQQEAIIKLQERSAEAMLNAREAKIIAESTQKEARASANATSVQMESTKNEIKAEMNAIKKATTNRLGN